MYTLERSYVPENWLFVEFNKTLQFLFGMIKVFQKGLQAARVAENNPEDHETISRTLTMD